MYLSRNALHLSRSFFKLSKECSFFSLASANSADSIVIYCPFLDLTLNSIRDSVLKNVALLTYLLITSAYAPVAVEATGIPAVSSSTTYITISFKSTIVIRMFVHLDLSLKPQLIELGAQVSSISPNFSSSITPPQEFFFSNPCPSKS